jgi:hypothetical protein
MLRKTLSKVTAVIGCLLMTQSAFGTFIPDKDIKNKNQVFSERDANMTQQEFDDVITKANAFYGPIVKSHGANLVINRRWTDDTLNANASQSLGTWTVNMYGGLARHPEMTLDGFAMVLCHEIGHHLAGFSFRKTFWGGAWAANEGQSDYFAAHSCARELWRNEHSTNAGFRANVNPIVQESCNRVWPTTEEQDLCYRVNAGGESLSRVLSALKEDPVMPAYDTPDKNKVSTTNHNHPEAQCRMDTTYAASICAQSFAIDLIPGKTKSDQFGADAEVESSLYTCMEYSHFTEGLRPRCWFKPGI